MSDRESGQNIIKGDIIIMKFSEITPLVRPKIKEMSAEELYNKVTEISEQIKFITELPQQYTLSRYIVKYLNELKIEVLGEIERREGKEVTNSIHIEKMWNRTIRHNCNEIDDIMLYGYRQFYFCDYVMINKIVDNMYILWENIYIPEKQRRNIML